MRGPRVVVGTKRTRDLGVIRPRSMSMEAATSTATASNAAPSGSLSARSADKTLQWSHNVVDPPPSARRLRTGSPSNAGSSSGRMSPRQQSLWQQSPRQQSPRSLSPRDVTSPRAPSPEKSVTLAQLEMLQSNRNPLDFNIFFQNQRISPTAPKQKELNPKYSMPAEIFFYVRPSTYPCSFPFPREHSETRYLHRASVESGYESAGPAMQLRFNPSTVVGLQPHHMVNGQCNAQLVIVVPSHHRINPTLAPTKITFTPTTFSQLHCHRDPGECKETLPRIIVPVTPVAMSLGVEPRSMTVVKNTRAILLKELLTPWGDTPKGQRMFFGLKRWKRVVDQLYTEEADKAKPLKRIADKLDVDSTVGTPFRFGKWYPRAALDVPPYTTIYFQNARVASCAPRPVRLPMKFLLPKTIYFYVRTMTAEVGFPLPEADYPSSKYLHCARVMPGHEAGGPASHLVWNVDTVVGLKKHQCLKSGAPVPSMQLVLVVPSWVSPDGTQAVNEGLEPRQLMFSPTNGSQLHMSSRLPRVICALFPRPSLDQTSRFLDGHTSGLRLHALRQLIGAWKSYTAHEIKLSAFNRWNKVCELMPSPNLWKPPESQLGTPYVEQLPDLGETKNRCRWPRLERAMQMAAAAQGRTAAFDKETERANFILAGGVPSGAVTKHAQQLKLDVAAAQQMSAKAQQQPSLTRSQSDGLMKPQSAPHPPSQQVHLQQDLARATPPTRRSESPMQSARGSAQLSAQSASPRRTFVEADAAAARAEARDALLELALARQAADGEGGGSSIGRSTPHSRATPRDFDERGTHMSTMPVNTTPRSVSPRPGAMTPRGGGPMVRAASSRSASPRFPRPGLNTSGAGAAGNRASGETTTASALPAAARGADAATILLEIPHSSRLSAEEDLAAQAFEALRHRPVPAEVLTAALESRLPLPPPPPWEEPEVAQRVPLVEPSEEELHRHQSFFDATLSMPGHMPIIMSSGRARALAAAGGGRL